MLADEAISLLSMRLGFRQDQNANLLTAMTFCQQQLLDRGMVEPKFLRTWNTGLTTVANQNYIDLPTDFGRELAEWDDGGLYIKTQEPLPTSMDMGYFVENYAFSDTAPQGLSSWGGSFKRLTPQALSSLVSYQEVSATLPIYYNILGTKIQLLPTPDKVYTLNFIYLKKDSAPALGQTNLWLTYAADLLMAETGLFLGTSLRSDDTVMQMFAQEKREAIVRLTAVEQEAQYQSGTRHIVGGKR